MLKEKSTIRSTSLEIIRKKIFEVNQFLEKNLLSIYIILKNNGTVLFHRNFKDRPREPHLFGAFLEAIQNLLSKEFSKMGGIQEILFQNYKIIFKTGKYVRIALILLKKPSKIILSIAENFLNEFESKYDEALYNFNGNINQFNIFKIIQKVNFNLYSKKLTWGE
ncbi:MAG: hypothetical protein ACFFDN_36235 [Candidatus Hodarchaeota archaeon]